MATRGPQEERFESWLVEGASESLGVPEARAPIDVDNTRSSVAVYVQQIKQLQNENLFVKEQLRRLEAEYTRNPAGVDTDPIPPPWTTSPTHMGPLVSAYDQRIEELERALDESVDGIAALQRRYRDLETENASLRESAATATRAQVSELQQDHSVASSGLPATVAAETVREAHEQLEVLLKENTVLSEQVSVLESERQKYVDLAKRRSDELATITASFNTATSALQRLKDAVVVLRAQKQFCEETIKEKVNQVTDLEVERERLVEEMRVQDNSMQALQTQVAEHKKFAQQLSERALAESEFLDRQSLLVSTRSRELKNELDQKEAMLDSLKDAHRALKLEHDKTRQDCEGMLKVMSGLEKQVVDLAAREARLTKLVADAESTREEALLQRQQALVREQQTSEERDHALKAIAEAETHAQEQHEKTVVLWQGNVRAMQEANNDEIKRLVAEAARLGEQTARAKREQQQAEKRLAALVDSVTQEKERLNKHAEELSHQVEAQLITLQSRESEALAARQGAQEASHKLDVERQDLLRRLENERAVLAQTKNELERTKERARGLAAQVEAAKERTTSTQRATEASMHELRARLESQQRQMTSRLEEAERELASTREELQVAQVALRDAKMNDERLLGRARQDFEGERGRLSRALEEQQEECTRLRKRAHDLALTVESMRHQAQSEQDDKRLGSTRTAQLTSALEHAMRQLQSAKAQVAELMEREEAYLSEAKRLKVAVSQGQLELERAMNASTGRRRHVRAHVGGETTAAARHGDAAAG